MTKIKLVKISNKPILSEPGDELSARITESNRKVIKVSKNHGKNKYSATQYQNGTIVKTETIKQN